jgi:ABC-type transport system involved in cytochrome bd biosynthesis fused ATPase/permease subunit
MGLERARSGDVQPISRKLAHIHPNTFFPSGTLRSILDPSSLCSDGDISTQLEVLGLASPRFRSLDEKFLGQGRTLSDGERVRISIARALLMKVDVFILDDVAGLLDDSSLAAVRRALVEQEHVSLIEAAHERSILQPDSADCVVRL